MHLMLGFYFNTCIFVLLFSFFSLLSFFTIVYININSFFFYTSFFIVSIFFVCVCLCWYNFLYPSQFIVVLLSCYGDLFTLLPYCETFQSQLHHIQCLGANGTSFLVLLLILNFWIVYFVRFLIFYWNFWKCGQTY